MYIHTHHKLQMEKVNADWEAHGKRHLNNDDNQPPASPKKRNDNTSRKGCPNRNGRGVYTPCCFSHLRRKPGLCMRHSRVSQHSDRRTYAVCRHITEQDAQNQAIAAVGPLLCLEKIYFCISKMTTRQPTPEISVITLLSMSK